jgi:hypothetical protein
MKLAWKTGLFVFLLPSLLQAQPGVRMSADFLPLEVGNQWTYEVFNEAGQKTGTLEFGVMEYRIVSGRSFYRLNQFPFVEDGASLSLIRYDRQERQYMRMIDNEEGPLFLADGTRVEVLQTDDSKLPLKFVLRGDLVDLTFQRGMGIVEARMHAGRDVQIAKLSAVRVGERRAAEAVSKGAPALPQPPPPDQKNKGLADNVVAASEDTVVLDVQASAVSGGTKFVLTVINSTDKLVPFRFNSGQTYDFRVIDPGTGQEIWSWARRMFFTQVIRQEALRPNRNWTYEVVWNHRDNELNVVPPGTYQVIGSIATQPAMESEPASFEIK